MTTTKPHERLMRLWATQLERKLLMYIEAVGPYYTHDDLLQLCRSSKRPMATNFSPEYERNAFYEMVIHGVISATLEPELSSEVFERKDVSATAGPPFNAEYFLYFFLQRDERDVVIGDLVECYGQVFARFGKRRADNWFYKQVIGSLWPLFKRAVLKIGALVTLGRILRRFIS